MPWWTNNPYDDPRVTAIDGSADYDTEQPASDGTWASDGHGSECGAAVKGYMANAIEHGHPIEVSGPVVVITDHDDPSSKIRWVPRR